MRKTFKLLLDIAIYIGIVIVLVWGIPRGLSWALETEYPMAAITSGSMWPVLKKGDLVLIQKVGREELKVGDIVVWSNPKGFTIHRLVKLNPDTFVTRGDGNFKDDAAVPYKDLVGRALTLGKKPLRIPYLGYISVYGGSIRTAQSRN
jgi:signal peptidase I